MLACVHEPWRGRRASHRARPSPAVPSPHPACRARGWARLGAAQLCLGHPRPALAAYQRGLALSPGNEEMRRGEALAEEHVRASAGRRRAQHHD